MKLLLPLLVVLLVNGTAASSIVSIYDETGNLLFETGLEVAVGDYFLDPDNRKYIIFEVQEATARARYLETVSLEERFPKDTFQRGLLGAAADVVRFDRIGLYHTHDAEAYLPTSGVQAKEEGDILQVGRTMAQCLEEEGVQVLHRDTSHAPIDGLAYQRSRRTATELTQQKVDALFDIHRDSPPAHVYAHRLAGEDLTKILLVIGAGNPMMSLNEEFALALKHYADQEYPGLIRGIYYSRGSFNQDLHPRALLLEVGTVHSNLEEAQRGAQLMAQVVTTVLYGAGVGLLSEAQNTSAAWLVILVLILVSIALLLDRERYQRFNQWVRRLRDRLFRPRV